MSELARRAHTRADEAAARAREAEAAEVAQRTLARRTGRAAAGRDPGSPRVSTGEIFEAVTREVGLLCDADLARMERFEAGHAVTALAAWARDDRAELAVGTRFALEGASIAARFGRPGGRPASIRSPARRADRG